MKGRRERRTVQVLILSLVVGALCFLFSFFILVLVGIYSGFLDLILSVEGRRDGYAGIGLGADEITKCSLRRLVRDPPAVTPGMPDLRRRDERYKQVQPAKIPAL